MGVFERIRTASPYLLAAFAVIFVLFMVLGDMNIASLNNGNTSPENRIVAEVNGEGIKYNDFEMVVKNASEQQKQQAIQTGQEPQVDESQIRTGAFRQLVDLNIKRSYVKDAGIVLSDNVVGDILVNNPTRDLQQIFTDSTGFQKNLYIRAATNPDNFVNIVYPAQATQIQEQQRKDIVKQWKRQLVYSTNTTKNRLVETNTKYLLNSTSSYESDLALKDEFLRERSYADFEYIYVPYTDFREFNEEPTQEQIQDYYNDNKESFKKSEARKITYVAIPFAPSAEDSSRAREQNSKLRSMISQTSTTIGRLKGFEKAYDEFGGESEVDVFISDIDPLIATYIKDAEQNQVLGPVSLNGFTNYIKIDRISNDESNAKVNASHILINFNNDKDSAYAAALEIYNDLKDTPEDFSDFARAHSQGPSSTKGGELGWFGKGAMVPEFEEAVFGAEIGEVTKPVESQFGYHLIIVNDKNTKKYSYSQISVKPKISQSTKKKIYITANNLSDKCKNGEDINVVAEEFGLKTTESGFFEENQSILGSEYVTWFAFNNEKGSVSEAFELENYGAVVVEITDQRKAGVPDLASIENEIKAYAKNDLKRKALTNKLEKVYPAVKDGDLSKASSVDPSLEVLRTSNNKNNGTIQRVAGREYKVTETIFSMEPGQVSPVITGNTGVFIVKLLSKNVPNFEDFATSYENFKQSKINANSSMYFQWFRELKKQANIDDKRYEIYNTNF